MKIGIDIRVLSNIRTGIGRFTKELLYSFASVDSENQYFLFYNVSKAGFPVDLPCPEHFKYIKVNVPNQILNILWAYTSFPKVESLVGKIDVFHGPSFQMPPTKDAAKVLTIHDLVFLIHPEMAMPAAVRHFGRRIREYAKRADIIVADSKSTAVDITRHIGVSPEKVFTVYPGANILSRANELEIEKVRKLYGIDREFIVFVGSIEPRKNLERLIKAFDYSKLGKDLLLVIVGTKGWHFREFFETWHSLSCRDSIRWLDYVDDQTLCALYSGALFLAYPSVMEGFGFPILEAMSVGCPVLTSILSSMPEVAGAGAYYVNPLDIDSITEGILKLSNDSGLRNTLIREGYNRLDNFTWEKTARQMIDVYRKACEYSKIPDNHSSAGNN